MDLNRPSEVNFEESINNQLTNKIFKTLNKDNAHNDNDLATAIEKPVGSSASDELEEPFVEKISTLNLNSEAKPDSSDSSENSEESDQIWTEDGYRDHNDEHLKINLKKSRRNETHLKKNRRKIKTLSLEFERKMELKNEKKRKNFEKGAF